MKKKIFIVLSSEYYYKYVSLKSFKDLEKKYKVFYLLNKDNFSDWKNINLKNKLFYKLNRKSRINVMHFLDYLRICNHHKSKTFKSTTTWYLPNLDGFKQIYKSEYKEKNFFLSYLKILLKKSIFSILSLRIFSSFIKNFVYKNILIEKNLSKIFNETKPELVIYTTHSYEPEVIKLKKLSEVYNFKTFYIVDNWDNLTTKTYYQYKPDYIGVWGNQSKTHANHIHNFRKKNIFLIGNCRFDNYFNLKINKFKNSKNRDYILFLGANIRVDEFYYLKIINNLIDENKKIFKNAKVIYRQHPQSKNFIKASSLKYLKNIILDETVMRENKIPYFKNNFNLTKKNYIPLVINAKFITGCVTSVMVEGLIFNKEYLVIAFKKKFDSYFNAEMHFNNHLHYEGLEKVSNVNITFDEESYKKNFIKMFEKKIIKSNINQTRKELDLFYHKDNLKYSDRIKKIVKKIL